MSGEIYQLQKVRSVHCEYNQVNWTTLSVKNAILKTVKIAHIFTFLRTSFFRLVQFLCNQ
jgi:hypothetical protein